MCINDIFLKTLKNDKICPFLREREREFKYLLLSFLIQVPSQRIAPNLNT